jgi:putative phosphoesterase
VRVAVLADTHLPRGARRLPEACFEELTRAELILHAGDFVAASVLEELERFAPVKAVAGNMDDAALRAALPARLVVEVEGVRVGMVHDAGPASGREQRLRAAFPACGAVVYGHTHLPQVDDVAGTWILNPGSPTERRRAPARSMLVVIVADAWLTPELIHV